MKIVEQLDDIGVILDAHDWHNAYNEAYGEKFDNEEMAAIAATIKKKEEND
jgi:hypothetical protein